MASERRGFTDRPGGRRSLALGALLSLLAVGAALAPGGCIFSTTGFGTGGAGGSTSSASGGATSTSSSSSGAGGCQSASDCDDKNSCTNDACKDGTCTHTPKQGCEPCDTTASCTPLDCQIASCVNGGCNYAPAAQGAPAGNTTPKNDCKKKQCDGSGSTEDVADPTDLPVDDGNPCTDEVCNGTTPGTTPKNVGDACPTGVCNAAQQCVTCTGAFGCPQGTTCDQEQACVSCTDAVQNGAETDVDCGGGTCPGCDFGESCNVNTDCVAMQCLAGTLDSAKLCCNLAGCSGPCGACDLPYAPGACLALPKSFVGLPACPGGQMCNGFGSCAADNKSGLAAPCSGASDCANTTCSAGLCKLTINDWCVADIECFTGRCFQNQCKACANGPECASGQCSVGICKQPGGFPCSTPGECANGSCQFGYCILNDGASCNSYADCKSRVCTAGVCQACVTNNDCQAGTTCTNGNCNAPIGKPCVNNTDCGSNNCSAIPTNPFKECR